MADLEDLSNRTLGEFILRERIGEGGYGAVYLCRQPLLGRDAVVKVLKQRARRDDVTLQRFQREVQLASLFNHPYAAHVYAFGVEQDGLLWIAMELVHGVTLSRWLAKHGAMPLEQFLQFFERVTEVIDAAHERGIIHRDVKPSNVMVTKRAGRLIPKLLDFGVAKMLDEVLLQSPPAWLELPALDDDARPDEDAAAASERTIDGRNSRRAAQPQRGPYRLTPVGAAVGSPPYMAPEQSTNAMAAGPPSDLYSLAVVAYEALTGSPPFDAASADELRELHRCAPVPPLGKGFSPAFDQIFARALAKQPEDRFPSATAFFDALKAAAEERMLARIRSAAHQWHGRGRPDELLWRGKVLEELETWVDRTDAALGNAELEFTEASRQHENALAEASRRLAEASRRRRTRMRRGGMVLAAAITLTVVGVLLDRASLQAGMNEKIAIQSEFEQGRQALLHDEHAAAQQHLSQAWRRGDHSPATAFMLARARQPLSAELARLSAVSGRMWSAAWSPDGRRIVTTDDRAVQVWDATTYRLVATLPHGDTVYHAVFSGDGTRLVTACGDGAVRIWNASTGEKVRELRRPKDAPRWYLVAVLAGGQLVAAIDIGGRVTEVWDARTSNVVTELRNDGSEWPSLSFSADGRWLAASGGNDVQLLDTVTRAVGTIPDIKARALVWDPAGWRLLVGGAGGDASIWDALSRARLQHLRDVGDAVDAVAWSPDGRLVALASRDGAEQVFAIASGKLVASANHLHSKIIGMEFDPASHLVAAGAASGEIGIMDAELGLPIMMLEASHSTVRAAHFAPGDPRIVGASFDGTAFVWNAAPPYQRWGSPPLADSCDVATALEPDARFVAIGCRDHATRVWDTALDQLLAELPGMTAPRGDVGPALPAITVAGDRVAIARDNTVEVYEIPGGRRLAEIRHPAPVSAIAFRRSGHDLVTGAADGSLCLSRDYEAPIWLTPGPAGIDAVESLTDGRIVVADKRGRLRILDGNRRAIVAELDAGARIGLLRPSPDGHALLTVAREAAAPILWDLDRYRVIASLTGNVGRVFAARWIEDGRILTAGSDGVARMWYGNGLPGQTYRGAARLTDVTMSPSGKFVVAGGSDGRLRYWDAVSGRALWVTEAHKSAVVGIHFEGASLVTRGFGGEVSRWMIEDGCSQCDIVAQ